jgi:hypothetical protein
MDLYFECESEIPAEAVPTATAIAVMLARCGDRRAAEKIIADRPKDQPDGIAWLKGVLGTGPRTCKFLGAFADSLGPCDVFVHESATFLDEGSELNGQVTQNANEWLHSVAESRLEDLRESGVAQAKNAARRWKVVDRALTAERARCSRRTGSRGCKRDFTLCRHGFPPKQRRVSEKICASLKPCKWDSIGGRGRCARARPRIRKGADGADGAVLAA